MKDMELLCRASAFLLKSKASSSPQIQFRNKYHVLTVSHAVAPWRWPKLYPQDWVRFVNESHTHYTIEARYPDGTLMNQTDLLPRSFHHGGGRDLAVLHIEPRQEDAVLELFKGLSVEDELQLLSHSDTSSHLGSQLCSSGYGSFLQPGQVVHFHGHKVKGTAVNGGGDGGGGDMGAAMSASPSVVRGVILGTSAAGQTFAQTLFRTQHQQRRSGSAQGTMALRGTRGTRGSTGTGTGIGTGEVLADGMCGGPVVVTTAQSGTSISTSISTAPATAEYRGGKTAVLSGADSGGTAATAAAGSDTGAGESRSKPKTRRRGVHLSEVKSYSKQQQQEDSNTVSAASSALRVVGLLEGIVPLLETQQSEEQAAVLNVKNSENCDPLREVRGSAVFVEAADIQKFLTAVEHHPAASSSVDYGTCSSGGKRSQFETEAVTAVAAESESGESEVVFLVGGQAAEAVGKDQDPDKMDLSKVF